MYICTQITIIKKIEIMKNERNAGRKTKFKDGIFTMMLHVKIPMERKKEILKTIEKICTNELR